MPKPKAQRGGGGKMIQRANDADADIVPAQTRGQHGHDASLGTPCKGLVLDAMCSSLEEIINLMGNLFTDRGLPSELNSRFARIESPKRGVPDLVWSASKCLDYMRP